MNTNTLLSIWSEHRSSGLHNKDIYSSNTEARIEYTSSGVVASSTSSGNGSGAEGYRLSTFLDKYPTSPLNLPGCKWTPTNTMHSGSTILEQGVLSLKKATCPTKATPSTAKAILSAAVEEVSTLDGTQLDALLGTLLSGWFPVEMTLESFRPLNLRMVVTAIYDDTCAGKIKHISFFWNQAELLQQLGLWQWIDEMKPGPALKNFILRLPLQSSVPHPTVPEQAPVSVSDNVFATTSTSSTTTSNNMVFPTTGSERMATKVNCRHVGGATSIVLADEEDPSNPATSAITGSSVPATKVNCKQIGGVDHFFSILQGENDNVESTPTRSREKVTTSPNVIPPWESENTIRDSPIKGHYNIPDHFSGAVLREEALPGVLASPNPRLKDRKHQDLTEFEQLLEHQFTLSCMMQSDSDKPIKKPSHLNSNISFY
jgi:hypothetical protein